MKRVLFVVGLLLISSAFSFAQQKDAKLEATLIQMDKDWTAAELRGDRKAVSNVVANDFSATTPNGMRQNKAQYLTDVKASKDTDMADEYEVRFFSPDVAVMTHRGTVNGEKPLQYRSTHVWVNRAGKWQIVAHHSSEIAADANAASVKAAPAPTSQRKPKIAPMSATAAPSVEEAPKK